MRRKLLAEAPGILDPATSRIAVISNLYGDGMQGMLCNLLYNPQVRHLIAIGNEVAGPTCHEIEQFLADGLEDARQLGRPVWRIVGTNRIFEPIAEFDADTLRDELTFQYLGRIGSPGLTQRLTAYLEKLPHGPRVRGRIDARLPDFDPDDHVFLPSEPGGHQVIRERPLDAWRELVVRCMRFGHPTPVGDGTRLELLDVKVVITEPAPEPADELAEYGFSAEDFADYQRKILDPVMPEQQPYSYGNRLRGHFAVPSGGTDTLAAVIQALRRSPATRRAYISLWDDTTDLPSGTDGDDPATPCLATIFFRVYDDRLHVSATYRAHNLLKAWLQNVYGLMAIQRHVATGAILEPGSITVLSHTIGIDPTKPRFALANTIADRRQAEGYRYDPHGHFAVTVDPDDGLIIAEHRFEGMVLKRYRAKTAKEITRLVDADRAVSLVSHALWLAGELAAAERELKGRL